MSFSEFSRSKFGVNSENLADKETESSSDTLDLIEGKRDSSLTINVGVEDTMNVLEAVLGVFDDK